MPQITTQAALAVRANTFPQGLLSPLGAHISGPQAALHRYAVAAEKNLISLGAYVPGGNTQYSYPDKTAGTIVDQSYVKLYVDDGQLQYFNNPISGGANTIIPVADYTNRIKISSGSTVFKGNGASYPRSTDLKADVQVGDIINIRAVISSTNVTLQTYVAGFVANVVAAVTGSATGDSGNTTTQGSSTSSSQVAGTTNCAVISAVTGTAYDGTVSGHISETYTITVTEGSAGGDATTAVLQVISTSGTDNQASVTPAAFSSPTSIGTRGLTVTWVNTITGGCSGVDFVVGQQWTATVNQAVTAPNAGTSGGTYTGTNNTTYLVKVSRGGKYTTIQSVANPGSTPALSNAATGGSVAANTYYAVFTYAGATTGETIISTSQTTTTTSGSASTLTLQSPPAVNGSTTFNLYVGTVIGTYHKQGSANTTGTPVTITSYNSGGAAPPGSNTATGVQPNPSPPQVTVTTSTGSDLSGPTSIALTGSGVTFSAAAINIGTQGLTWTPGATNLVKGDIYDIEATAATSGSYQTLILADSMPTTPLDMTSASGLEVKISVPVSGLKITANRTPSPPNVNYVVTSTTFTTKLGITAGNSRWTDGTQYPLVAGNLFLEYREWLQTNAGTVGTLSSANNLATVLGTVDPDNPLCWGVYKALQNSNGLSVYYTAVADPSSTSDWQSVLDTIDSQSGCYGLVPLTTNPDVLTLYKAHVDSQSQSAFGAYKTLWVQLTGNSTKVVVNSTTSTNSQAVLATLIENPAAAGQYTYLQVPAGNADFVTNGVQAGDTVRYLFTTDGFGNSVWTSFTVASVVNEDTLILVTGNSVPVNSAQLVEVWHNLSATEMETDLAAQATAYSDSRVKAVWPDTVVEGSNTFAGYFACACLAGLTSSMPFQQGVTNVQVLGITDVPRTYNVFNSALRRTLSANGVWLLDLDGTSGLIYTKRATTTDINSLQNQEESMVRNLDGVVFTVQRQLAKYYGITNVVTDLINQMTADIKSVKTFLLRVTNITALGASIKDLQLATIAQNVTLLDRVDVSLTISLNNPLNKVQITVTV